MHADELERAEVQQPSVDINDISNIDVQNPTSLGENPSNLGGLRVDSKMKGPPGVIS